MLTQTNRLRRATSMKASNPTTILINSSTQSECRQARVANMQTLCSSNQRGLASASVRTKTDSPILHC